MSRNLVCHITTVHLPNDVRIFHKECKTLRREGYEVSLIVPQAGELDADGIKVVGLPETTGRWKRFFVLPSLAFRKAQEVAADLYHIHDPELIPLGARLKKSGRVVVFDIHEDVGQQMLSKSYIPGIIRPLASFCYGVYERRTLRKFDGLVCATNHIWEKYRRLNMNTITVNNYPIIEEFGQANSWDKREDGVAYIGNMTRIRGIYEMVNAVENLEVNLHLAGEFENDRTRAELERMPGWKKVRYHGKLNRQEIVRLLNRVKIGLVVIWPEPNYVNAQSTKMYEYMIAGIPVIASDFPLWRSYVDSINCGLCVEPKDAQKLAAAIESLMKDQKKAEEMGRNGRRAIERDANWDNEGKKLAALYRDLLS